MQQNEQNKIIYLKDYQAPNYLLKSTELIFQLTEDATTVTSKLHFYKNPAVSNDKKLPDLQLQGENLETKHIAIDDKVLSSADYTIDNGLLTIAVANPEFVFEATVVIYPEKNTALEGLYRSKDLYCTQCEAEGFRCITWYPDRPDVLSIFTVTIIADDKFPLLLSNGNCLEKKVLANGMLQASWHDPHPKPAYLFALVAGDLAVLKDTFTTSSGREVSLEIYTEAKDTDKCYHAMDSLKRAMAWDEQVYGREYDLDTYMIVAVDDFNMGAMENKGLNVFNTSCVLADPSITTDAGYQRVEAVIAHEYFHNWSGNRVTCRDWFQLSLKEGFTVFRDSEFSADMGSRAVKRIEDVKFLRDYQFVEDAGPTAHPIRPSSYMEISNFYTVTIYEKGAEVVRMLYNLLGAEDFRKGSDLYFERFDGQAVTTDDFVGVMAEASGKDLAQFTRWYSQTGTPKVIVSDAYNDKDKTYSLTFKQQQKNTDSHIDNNKENNLHIPINLALLVDATPQIINQQVVELKKAEETIVYSNVTSKPTPSLLRGFSAPIQLDYPYTFEQLCHLLQNDTDGFSRWEASQQIAKRLLMSIYNEGKLNHEAQQYVDVCKVLLKQGSIDPAMLAQTLHLPDISWLLGQMHKGNPLQLNQAREQLKAFIAKELSQEFMDIYQRYQHSSSYEVTAEAIANRALKNTCLHYLSILAADSSKQLCQQQFINANNFTDRCAALTSVLEINDKALSEQLLNQAWDTWKGEALAVNTWFQLQGRSEVWGTTEKVKQLLKHPAFEIKNPNKVRALIGAYVGANTANFHAETGEGYQLLKEVVLTVDALNPQIASRLVMPLTRWHSYDEATASRMTSELQALAGHKLSKDLYEVVEKSLP